MPAPTPRLMLLSGAGLCRLFTARRKRAIQVRMRFLEIADDLEVHALDLGKIQLLDVHQPQQLLDRARHVAPAFIARTTALGDADLCPELLLVHAEAPPDFAGI